MNLKVLKWLAIVLPLLFLAAVDRLRYVFFQGQFYSPAALAFLFAILALAVFLFSHGVFGLINRLQGRVMAQNRHLGVLNTIATGSAESSGLDPLLNTSLEQILDVLRADAGLICIVDLVEGEHSAVCYRGFSAELVGGIQRVKLGQDPIA